MRQCSTQLPGKFFVFGSRGDFLQCRHDDRVSPRDGRGQECHQDSSLDRLYFSSILRTFEGILVNVER